MSSFVIELVCVRECASVALDDLAREPDACLDSSLEVLSLDNLRKETTDKGVARAVGINNEVLFNRRNSKLSLNGLLALLGNSDKNWVFALSDDGDARAALINLGPLGYGNGYVF